MSGARIVESEWDAFGRMKHHLVKVGHEISGTTDSCRLFGAVGCKIKPGDTYLALLDELRRRRANREKRL